MLTLHIPSEQALIIEDILLQTLGTAELSAVQPLSGGLSGAQVFKLEIAAQPYILKLDKAAAAAGNSANHQQLAGKAGVAPEVLYQNIANGISLIRHIDNKPIRSLLSPEQVATQLARTIQTIHTIEAEVPGRELLPTVDGLISGFKARRLLSGPVFDAAFSHYESIKSSYPWQDQERVFSHNDLNPNNILFDGEKIWVIDWDAAFINDRYIDLATAANFFIHTEEQERLFLDTYFGRDASDYETARLYTMRQLSRIIYSVLLFQVAAGSKPADYQHSQEMEGITLQEFGMQMQKGTISLGSYDGQLMYAKALLNEALRNMQSPRFAASLAILADN